MARLPTPAPEPTAATVELRGSLDGLAARLGAAPIDDAAGLDDATVTPDATVADRAERKRAATIPPGTLVGRYLVLDPIGRGGMGAIYRAYDPELDRRVAIKRVHLDGSATSQGQRHDRLLREAQALAQLNHPNVLGVHDVGLYKGAIFIAMELVEGQTLRRWLDGGKRRPAEVLAALCAAGDGLAAAHRVGLVHRDVKPGNLMIGDDGRVRVVDFGLARGMAPTSETPLAGVGSGVVVVRSSDASGSVSHEHGGRLIDTALTQVGSVLGTPRYMPPEQHVGMNVDARADQFSFCVCVYEALCGTLPFDGEVAEVRAAMEAGRRIDPARESRMPAHVRAAILRGLSPDPAARFPSMDELLVALRHDPQRRRRRWLLGVATLTVAGALAAVALWPRAVADPCAGGAARVQDVWNPRARAATDAGLAGTGRAHAAQTSARVGRALDDFAGRWADLYTTTCRATRVHRTLPEAVMTARTECLERRLAQVDRALALFGDADAGVADRAVRVVLAVTDLDDCVAARADAPPLEAERAAVAEVRRAVDESEVLSRAGRVRQAHVAATRAVEAALATSHAPTRARALLRLASVLDALGEADGAERAFGQALDEAAEAAEPELLALGWVGLSSVVGVMQARYDEALVLHGVARRAVITAGDDPVLHARMVRDLGAMQLERGDLTAARAAFEEELARVRAAPRVDPQAEATALNNLGAVLIEQGELAAAVPLLERAVLLLTQLLGTDHPNLSYPLVNQALALQDLGRFADSVPLLERAYAIDRAALGDDSPELAGTESALASGLIALDRLEEAAQLAERSLASRERSLGPDHPELAWSLQTLATVEEKRGHLERAFALLDRSLSIRKAALGADHAEVATSLTMIAELRCTHGDAAGGRRFYEDALAVYDRALGADHVRTAETVVLAAECLRGPALERLRPRLERALATLESVGAEATLVIRARAALARASR